MRLRWIMIGVLLLGLSRATAQHLHLASPEDHTTACSRKSFVSKGLLVDRGAYADDRIDVTYYKLDLTIQTAMGLVAGTVTVNATSLVDSLKEFTLDLGGTMTVDSVMLKGQPVSFIRYGEGIGIPLTLAASAGEALSVEVSYHGVPRVTGFGSFVFSSHGGTPWVWSLSEPYGAREWWPCKDHPLDKADSADIVIRCPSHFVVGSNGTLVDVVENGDGTSSWMWSERYPIATYLVSVALTNFVQFSNWFHYSPTDSMEILNMVLPEHEEEARAALPGTVRMMEIFSDLFGLYPFIKEKYGHAEFGWGGAMEHQTMTSTTTFSELTLAHELAHQWFGDLITCATWQDLWLNEGFATYSEALYREEQYGASDYLNHMRGEMSLARNAPGTLFVEDTSNVRNLFDNRRVYAKGASVLHMLRRVIGDSLFFASLRSYADDPRFRYATASTRDFQSVCERVTGQDLGSFFDQWVFGERHPVYEVHWESEPVESGYEVLMTLRQFTRTQNPEFFRMPVDIRLSSDSQDTTITVFHTESGEQFRVTLPFEPSTLELDPDEWILKEIALPDPGIPSSFSLEQNFPNPFNAGTSIGFRLPSRETIQLEVFDLLGRRVATLAKGQWEPGPHAVTWLGESEDGTPVASGVYIYRFSSASRSEAKTMLILR